MRDDGMLSELPEMTYSPHQMADYWKRCQWNNSPPKFVFLMYEVGPSALIRRVFVPLENVKILLTLASILASLSLIACGDLGGRPDREPEADVQMHTDLPTPTPEPTATAAAVVSEATLPVLSLTHNGRTLEARRYEACWTPAAASELECVESSPRGELENYHEVEGGDRIEITIMTDERPTKMLATVFTSPGEILVGELLHLSQVKPKLVVDLPPGRYNVRLHAQWFEGGSEINHEVNYVVGIKIPGEVALKRECMSTAQGGILGILLESLDDPARTAVDAVNFGGCSFNKEISQVVLTLENDSFRYVETFQLDPPSLQIGLPIPENTVSQSTGGPLPPGLYERKIVALTADGAEIEIPARQVKLSSGPADPDAPVLFLHHQEPPLTDLTAGPKQLDGYLHVLNNCLYLDNGKIPVWPSSFSVREQDGQVEVLDQHGVVVAREDHHATLNGRLVRATDPLGLELNNAMPLWCPPGDFWIVDSVSDSGNLNSDISGDDLALTALFRP